MKRFSKIFAVLFIVSLLCGIVAMSVSAAESNGRESLNVTGDSFNTYNDFSTDSKGGAYGTLSVNNATSGKPATWSRVKSADGSNWYARLAKGNDDAANSTGPEMQYVLNSFKFAPTNNIAFYDYIVVDYDFGTDQYTYKDSFGTWHTVDTFDEVPEEYKATADLAFVDGNTTLNIQARSATSKATTSADVTQGEIDGNKKERNFGQIYVVKNPDDGKWYFSTKQTYGADGAKYASMSNKINSLDHITYVIDIEVGKEGDLSDTKFYTFINGDYFSEGYINRETPKWITLQAVKSSMGGSAKAHDRYSFAFDNMAINWYKEYQEIETGIGTYITSGAYLNTPLYNCTDVVYDENYIAPGAPVLASLERLDGSVFECFNRGSIAKNIKDGDFITTSVDVLNYTPDETAINEVTFIVENGAKVSLSVEATELYMVQHTGNRYTVRLADDSVLSVKWYASSGLDAELLKEQKLVPMVKPNDSLKIYGLVDRTDESKPTIEIFEHWLWDKDCDGTGDEPASVILSKARTVSEINELREQGVDEIRIVPKYQTLPLLYSIELPESVGGSKPDFYTPDKNYAIFTDVDGFATAISGIKANDKVKVTLYSDIVVPAGKTATIAAGAEVTINLNGHSIVQNTESSTNTVFALKEAATLNLYSTAAGSYVAQEGVYGYGIITAPGVNSCNINISVGYDEEGKEIVNGESITFYGGSVFNFTTLTGIQNSDVKKINVNLNGGSYFGTIAQNDGLISVNNVDVVFDITNKAQLVALNGDSVFNVCSEKASIDITVHDSYIAAGECETSGEFVSGNAFGTWSPLSKAYIVECTFIGFENQDKVTLGNGNKFNGVIDSAVVLEKDIMVAFANNDVCNIAFDITTKDLGNITLSATGNMFTFAKDAELTSMEAPYNLIRKVTWLKPDGVTEHAVTYWVAGSEVEVNTGDLTYVDSSVFGDAKIADNGWFGANYSTWENATEGQGYIVSSDGDNKFKPVAKDYYAALDVVKVSIEISNQFAYNIYVPTPNIEGRTEEVKFIGFYNASGLLITSGVASDVTLEGVAGWNRFVGILAGEDFESDVITVKYSVDGKVLTSDVKVDIFDYMFKVDSIFGCGTEESKLVYAMMLYKFELFKATADENAPDYATEFLAIAEYLSSHGTGCKCGEIEYTAPDTTVEKGEIEDYVTLSYKLNLLDETGTYSFSVIAANDSDVQSVVINGQTIVGTDFGTYTEYVLENISLKDIKEIINISVITGGPQFDGAYCLAEYIKSNPDDTFAKALYVLSANAKDE